MFEKENNYNDDQYAKDLTDFSRFADEIMLDKQRQKFAQVGLVEQDPEIMVSFEIDDENINDYCIGNFIDPPNRVSISTFGDANGNTELSRRALYITLQSKEVSTRYSLKCNQPTTGVVRFKKTAKRIYGDPEFDRNGAFLSDTALIERLPSSELLSDTELELLYEIMMYVATNDLT